MAQPPINDAQKIAALRELLPATGAGIYLDTANAGPLPAETAAAMREAEEWELRVGRTTVGREDDVEQRAAEARAVVAALIGAEADQVMLAPGPELALVGGLWRLDWRSGDRLVASERNDPRLIRAIELFGSRSGVVVEVAGSVREAVDANTRLVFVPEVAPDTGEHLPLAELTDHLGSRAVRLAVDLSWSAGVLPVSVADLGADLVVLATDRWAMGPEETAAFWLTPEAAQAEPAPADVGRIGRTTLLGLARSVGWLEMYVGLGWAIERTARLARQLASRLADIEGVEVLTPAARLAGIITFRLSKDWSAEEVADELGRRVFAILRPLPELEAVRASVAWFNTDEELERLVAAVAEIAAHTPEDLPRRPALAVL